MSTHTATLVESASPSRLLSSTSSLGSQPTTNIARIYKQASQLFLTRRVQEALDLLEPIIFRPNLTDDTDAEQPAPIASASRGARVKVWSLYVSILNEIVNMGAELGKHAFGASKWKALVAKARTGTVWEDVIQHGYNGIEGDVDADVVANLATLLLTHSPSQKITQQRLEVYLSAYIAPFLDVQGHMQRPKSTRTHASNGTSTPRDLNSRLKILEIFTLHVLPRNAEWDYAREFIAMSEVLDEERRDAFLQALQSVRDDSNAEATREEQLQKQREQQLEAEKRNEQESRKAQQTQRPEPNQIHQRPIDAPSRTSEYDYGVDQSRIGGTAKAAGSSVALSNTAPTTPVRTTAGAKSSAIRQSRTSEPAKKAKAPPPGLYRRAALLMGGMQGLILGVGDSVRSNPAVVFRLLAFLLALLMALARRDVRDRLTRMRESSWDKIKSTIGMGVKVSYI